MRIKIKHLTITLLALLVSGGLWAKSTREIINDLLDYDFDGQFIISLFFLIFPIIKYGLLLLLLVSAYSLIIDKQSRSGLNWFEWFSYICLWFLGLIFLFVDLN